MPDQSTEPLLSHPGTGAAAPTPSEPPLPPLDLAYEPLPRYDFSKPPPPPVTSTDVIVEPLFPHSTTAPTASRDFALYTSEPVTIPEFVVRICVQAFLFFF